MKRIDSAGGQPAEMLIFSAFSNSKWHFLSSYFNSIHKYFSFLQKVFFYHFNKLKLFFLKIRKKFITRKFQNFKSLRNNCNQGFKKGDIFPLVNLLTFLLEIARMLEMRNSLRENSPKFFSFGSHIGILETFFWNSMDDATSIP